MLMFVKKELDRQKYIYTKGCVGQFEKWLQDNLIIVAGIFVGIALLQVMSCCLEISHIKIPAVSQMRPLIKTNNSSSFLILCLRFHLVLRTCNCSLGFFCCCWFFCLNAVT